MEERPSIFFSDGGGVGKILQVHYRGNAVDGIRLGSDQVVGYIDTRGKVKLDDGVKLGPEELQILVGKCVQVREMMQELLK